MFLSSLLPGDYLCLVDLRTGQSRNGGLGNRVTCVTVLYAQGSQESNT